MRETPPGMYQKQPRGQPPGQPPSPPKVIPAVAAAAWHCAASVITDEPAGHALLPLTPQTSLPARAHARVAANKRTNGRTHQTSATANKRTSTLARTAHPGGCAHGSRGRTRAQIVCSAYVQSVAARTRTRGYAHEHARARIRACTPGRLERTGHGGQGRRQRRGREARDGGGEPAGVCECAAVHRRGRCNARQAHHAMRNEKDATCNMQHESRAAAVAQCAQLIATCSNNTQRTTCPRATRP